MIELKNNPAGNFFLLAGPCVIEGEEMAMRIAERVVGVTEKLQIPYVFKGSYRKANRSRLDSFTGIGDEKALKVLKKVHDTFGVPTVTDIHSADEAEMAAEYVDILQIPAFLCRQTDLLVAAAKTGKTINIKKGQFLSPLAMQFAADKVVEAGNKNVMLTERGTTFGYQDLVVDYRGIPGNANVRLSGHTGCHPFIAATQPDQRSDRWYAPTDRNRSQSRHRRRSRRYLYRNTRKPRRSQERRSKHVEAGPSGRTINEISQNTGSYQITLFSARL